MVLDASVHGAQLSNCPAWRGGPAECDEHPTGPNHHWSAPAMANATVPPNSPLTQTRRAALVAPAPLWPGLAASAGEPPDPHIAWAAEADRLRPAMCAADDDTPD